MRAFVFTTVDTVVGEGEAQLEPAIIEDRLRRALWPHAIGAFKQVKLPEERSSE